MRQSYELRTTEGLEFIMNHPLSKLFDQFLIERRYLKNVTDRTLVWYQVAFKNYQRQLRPLPTLLLGCPQTLFADTFRPKRAASWISLAPLCRLLEWTNRRYAVMPSWAHEAASKP